MSDKYLTPVEVVQALQEGKKVLASHYGHGFNELYLTSSLQSILSGDFEFKLASQTVEEKADQYIRNFTIERNRNPRESFRYGFIEGYKARIGEEIG